MILHNGVASWRRIANCAITNKARPLCREGTGSGAQCDDLAANGGLGRQPKRAHAPRWTREKLFALFPNLGEMKSRPGGRMSGGEQQMLTVARTLMGNPLLVLLDEPSEGVAPLIVEQMAHTIVALKKQGLSILLSEQNIHFARLVSDRVYVLEKGQIHWQGSVAELDANLDVQRTYLTV